MTELVEDPVEVPARLTIALALRTAARGTVVVARRRQVVEADSAPG